MTVSTPAVNVAVTAALGGHGRGGERAGGEHAAGEQPASSVARHEVTSKH